MKIIKRMLMAVLAVFLCVTATVGCAPDATSTPEQSASPSIQPSVTPEVTPEPTPTVIPTPTPEPTPTDAPVPIDAYYLIKDGKSLVTFVRADKETETIKAAIRNLQDRILDRCGILIPDKSDAQLSKVKTPKIVIGKTKISSYDRLGESTPYEMLIELDGSDIYAFGYTQGATIDAFNHLVENMVIMNDGKNVYFKPDAFGGIKERPLPEAEHSWDEFTISGYGAPTFSTYDPDLWTEKDKETFQSLIDFGLAEIPVWLFGYANDKNFDKEAVKKYIEKFNSVGIKSRVYGFSRENYQNTDHVGNHNGDTKDYDALEACIKDIVETFGDMEGVAVWGFYDEPLQYDSFRYCSDVIELFNKYDDKDRPVYINMGPLAGQSWCDEPLEVYNKLKELADPDFYCFDRYPFWCVDENGKVAFGGEPVMYEEYWYSNMEMNRNMGIDTSKDTGIIIGCIVVGGTDGWNEGKAEISQDFMDWQVNLSLAYGYKYIEHFVIYSGHSHGIYTSNNEKTFRWEIAKNANDYANVVGPMLFDKKLDMVFHLANADGSYSPEILPYKPFRNVGEVTGCDAVLSFFEDGTIIVTDKRCCDRDGGDHDVTLSGLNGGVEWFNVASNAWEDISTCEGATVDENGLTLTLTRASQFIVRAK